MLRENSRPEQTRSALRRRLAMGLDAPSQGIPLSEEELDELVVDVDKPDDNEEGNLQE